MRVAGDRIPPSTRSQAPLWARGAGKKAGGQGYASEQSSGDRFSFPQILPVSKHDTIPQLLRALDNPDKYSYNDM